jgi:hypothetical protein
VLPRSNLQAGISCGMLRAVPARSPERRNKDSSAAQRVIVCFQIWPLAVTHPAGSVYKCYPILPRPSFSSFPPHRPFLCYYLLNLQPAQRISLATAPTPLAAAPPTSAMEPQAPPYAVMHTSRVSSTRYSASRVFFCLEIASLYSSSTRVYSSVPGTHFAFWPCVRHHSWLLRATREFATLPDSPARLAASCASLAVR